MKAGRRFWLFVVLAPWFLAAVAARSPVQIATIDAADTVDIAPDESGKIVIEYYGDSTVWGYAPDKDGQRVAMPAPAVFAKALPNSAQYEIRNEGVNGSTACDLLNGKDGKHPQWRTQMAASKATYVIVNHAINDQWKYDVARYKTCLLSLARIAQKRGKKIIFETPNPTRDSGSGGLDVYVNAMREVATQAEAPVIDQYRYLMDYLQGREYETICPDGLHPSEAVYRLKGEYAARVFVEQLTVR